MAEIARSIARVRVPLGFGCGLAALWLAHPTWASLASGASLAAAGESIRLWAAGHLEKGREVTRSGPYRFTGHPLYLGSAVVGAGIAVASRSVSVAVIAVLYLGIAVGATVRSEEAEMRAKFGRDYVEFRTAPASGAERRFSLARAFRNGERRALAGLAAAVILLAVKTWLRL
jgi:protein-S-isoprenylcysteine O-methyltransferase Ste14